MTDLITSGMYKTVAAILTAIAIISTVGLCGCSGDSSKWQVISGADADMQGGGSSVSDATEWRETATLMSALETDITPENDGESDVSDTSGGVLPEVYDVEPVEYEHTLADYMEIYEAEEGEITGNATVSDSRDGYSGGGFVRTGGDGMVTVILNLPTSQHYDITVRIASNVAATGVFTVNGKPCAGFETSGSGEFEAFRFANIYLEAGESMVELSDLSANVDFDCAVVENSEEIYTQYYNLSTQLCTPDADQKARILYGRILSVYGRKMLSGQQCSRGTNDELEAIYHQTGRYPAIRFGDLLDYSSGYDSGDIELALDWAANGGIVGYTWNWQIDGSVYAANTDFKLSDAVCELDVSRMDTAELELRLRDGLITESTIEIIEGIDAVATQLSRLRDAGVPVIFRPLPEASLGWFWWSESSENYKWLYKLIFDRLTGYHGLTNLIWVWNGQSADYYVGDDMCDIISLDIYDGSKSASDSGVNYLLTARTISDAKPIAISECDVLPSPDAVSRDLAYWSFASLWEGGYAESEEYMTNGDKSSFYNSTIVLTLDEIENKW